MSNNLNIIPKETILKSCTKYSKNRHFTPSCLSLRTLNLNSKWAAATLPVTAFSFANTMRRDVIQYNLMYISSHNTCLKEGNGKEVPLGEKVRLYRMSLSVYVKNEGLRWCVRACVLKHLLLLCSSSHSAKPKGCAFPAVHSPTHPHQPT